jgi:hypothetical protein
MSELKLESLKVTSIIKDATNNRTNDGYIELSIEGGVPPYRVTWDIGKTTKDIYKLYSGDYTVKIVDSSGNFNFSETYTVNVIEEILPTPSITPTLTPTPTPSYNVTNLCLTNKYENYTFTYFGRDKNGYDTWFNNDNKLKIYFDTKFSRWEVLGWDNIKSGVLVKETKSIIPLGDWKVLGDIKTKYVWTITEGSCSDLPLDVSVYVNHESCFGKNNGTVKIIPKNGIGTYQYRIKGVKPYPNYVLTDTFTKLKPDTYTVEVTDGSRNITESFIINEGQFSEQYTFNLNSKLTKDNLGNKTIRYSVEVIPELPSEFELSIDLNFTHTKRYRDNGTFDTFYDMSYQTNEEQGEFNPITLLNSASTEVCDSVNEIVEIYEHEKTFNIKQGTKISGEYSYGGSLDSTEVDCDCPMVGDYYIKGFIKNIRVIDDNRCVSYLFNNNFDTRINLKNCLK